MIIKGKITELKRLKNTVNGNPMWSLALTGESLVGPWSYRIRTESDSQCAYLISPNWEGRQVKAHMLSKTVFDGIELLD